MGDDVQVKTLKYYAAFRRIKNFACIYVSPRKKVITLHLKVDPKSLPLEKGFTRDLTKAKHYGPMRLEVTIKSDDDLTRAQPLVFKSYEAS